MYRLVENEIRLFINLKLIICTILSFVFVIFIYNMFFLDSFENYEIELNAHYNDLALPIDGAIVRLSRDINLLNDKIDEADTDDYDLEYLESERNDLGRIRRKYEDLLFYLSPITANTKLIENYDEFENYMADVDDYIKKEFIEAIKQKKNLYFYDGYALSNEIDWASRIKLREWRLLNNGINPSIITSSRLLSYLLNGSSIVFEIITLIIIIVLNYDIWSRDFTENNNKLLYTIPYSRKKIYFIRFFSRLIITMLIIFIPIVVLIIYVNYKHGLGMNDITLVSGNLLKLDFFNSYLYENLKQNNFLNLVKPIALWKYNILLVTFRILWIAFIYSLINLADITMKNGFITIIFGVLIIFFSINSQTLSLLNPFSYLYIEDILNGFTRYGPYKFELINFSLEILLFIIVSIIIILYFVSEIIFIKRKV